MNFIRNKKDIAIHVLLSLFIFSATLPMTELYELSKFRNVLLYSIMICIGVMKFKDVKVRDGKGKLLLVWIIMSLFLAISTILIDLDIVNLISYLIISPYIFFFLFKVSLNGNISNLIQVGIYGIAPYILISIIKYPHIYSLAYRGIFKNSNQMGLCAAFLVLCFWFNRKQKKVLILRILDYLLIYICLAIMISASSRTAIISLILSLCTYWIIKKSFGRKEYKKVNIIIISILITLILLNTLLLINGINIINFKNNDMYLQIQNIIEKNIYYSETGNLSNGRTFIWANTLQDGKMFGHGQEYFINKYGLAAHNSIIEFYGVYGAITSVMLLVLFLCSLTESIKLAYRYKIFEPLVLITFFICINMAESIFASIGLGINAFYLMLFGILNNYNVSELSKK